jgi:dipeptidyl aminopeptidase/acylaminoacyl peptidase
MIRLPCAVDQQLRDALRSRALRLDMRFLALAAGCAALLFPAFLSAQDNPKLTIDEECTAFAFAPDGRIAYSVRHIMKIKHYDLQRDDIWVTTLEGKRTRIVNGEKLVKSPAPFSYGVQSLRWSPDGHMLTVEMLTDEVIDERGNTREGQIIDLMSDDGKEINIAGTKNSVIPNATQAQWLSDGVTVVFVTEAVKPKLLFSIGSVRPLGGRGETLFENRFFSAVAWDAKRNIAVTIERDKDISGPIQLVSLDLAKQTRRELATLDRYLGQLSLSPSATKVAYFRDGDTLEVRNVSAPEKVTSIKAGYGHFEWSRDERRLLLKRGPERKSGDLIWVSIPDGQFEPLLHSLTFRDFAISADGQYLGVTQPGTRNLLVYPIP